MGAVNRDLGVKAGLAIAATIALCGAALLAFLLVGEKADAAGASASGSATVGMKNFQFRPGTLNVSKGTRVVFSNNSGVAHNATMKGSFATGTIRPGRAVAVRFSAKGTYRYHCTIHPEMRGRIVVD